MHRSRLTPLLVLLAAALTLLSVAGTAAAQSLPILSKTTNTQIRQAVSTTGTFPNEEPNFGAAEAGWRAPVTAAGGQGHPYFGRIPGTDWLAWTSSNNEVVNPRWTQYRTTFTQPAVGTSGVGVRLLVDNQVTGITLNGVAVPGCTRNGTPRCEGFDPAQRPYAIPMPENALNARGTTNTVVFVVANYEQFATGGLDFAIVARGTELKTAAPDTSAGGLQQMTTSGSFQQTFESDAGVPITLTANNTVGSFVDNGNGTWSWTYTVPKGTPPSSANQITVTASSTSGDATTDSFLYAVLDRAQPVVTAPQDPPPAEATGPNGAVVTFPAATATDDLDADTTATCTPASGSEFVVGQSVVTCSYTDAAGKTGSDTLSVSVVDTTGPVVTAPDDKRAEATGPDGALVTYSGASAHDAVNGARTVNCAPASGSQFAIGETVVTCSASDSRGNPGTATFEITVADTTGPSVTAPADQSTEATGHGGAVVTYSGASATDVVDGARPVTCAPASGSTFAVGETVVTCSASDTRDNAGSDTFKVTVTDTIAPAVTAPADKSAEATGPAGAAVTYSGASATDLVDGAPAVTCTPASGSTFALGDTVVTCSSTDAAGNQGSDSFEVSVVDTTAPAVTVPDDRTAEATGASGAVVTYSGASATDLVDGARPVTCAPASGSTFALGKTEVTCSAGDTRGNGASKTFTVSVVDTTAPTLTLPADKTSRAFGPYGAAVSYDAPRATDAVDGAVVATCTPKSGSTFAPGTTTNVTCQATDRAGNRRTQTFKVTVEPWAPAGLVPAATERPAVRVTCTSRRTVTIHISRHLGRKVTSVQATVAGERVKPRGRTGRFTVLVDMRGRGRTVVPVKLRLRLQGGRAVTVDRAFRTCRPRA